LLWLSTQAADQSSVQKAADGVFGMRFSADGRYALFVHAHLTDTSFDLFVRHLDSGTQTSVDQFVEWPALIGGPTGEFIAYVVNEPSRAGLYVAETPKAAPAPTPKAEVLAPRGETN
jgi:hypothetical protein